MSEVSSSKNPHCPVQLSVRIARDFRESRLHTNPRIQSSATEITQRIHPAYMTWDAAFGLENTHGKDEQGNFAPGLRGRRPDTTAWRNIRLTRPRGIPGCHVECDFDPIG